MSKKFTFKCVLVSILFAGLLCNAKAQSFNSSGLSGVSLNNPTSLQFGPDGRLYVSEQKQLIKIYTIERDNAAPGSGSYSVTETETISLIKNNVPNHDDDGTLNATQQRQVTGILVAGTAANPVLYVTSSDSRIAGGGSGNDSDLDTNSGVISRLTWNGTAWEKVDLVRGLPRCEENHSINGMDMFERGGDTYLLVQQGGHTNKGAPSNNFAGTPEYFFSGSLLIVNLSQLESMSVYTDPRTNTDYVYDLPTLDDPTRPNITNTDAEFPYVAGHPMYNASIDPGDPFGGNNGLNQAFPEPGGPVQTFSHGYRNAYDVVVMEDGRIYTSDNGPNGSWGGQPKIYLQSDDSYVGVQGESGVNYDPSIHYIKNEFNESSSNGHGDPLHYVGTINDANGTYYAGHPAPIQAFPSRADIIVYEDQGSWTETSRHTLAELLTGTSGYFNSSFSINDFPDRPEEGEYLADNSQPGKVNILDVVGASTNGITEYTASNFEGAMQGDILTASYNGNIYRYKTETSPDNASLDESLFSGFGSQPLDVTAQGDDDIFPGTVWAATYGANNITVFEPADFGNCPQPGDPDYDPDGDSDNDGYTNQDEIDNGTNHCSGGSKPNDYDNDQISDLNDDDDDNDGILDVNDKFAIDPDNGTSTNLPLNYPFWNNDPGTGFFGLGFTGLMLNPTSPTDYINQFDELNLSFGGAAGKASIDAVSEGDAYENDNNQENAFQVGVNVDVNSNPFTIHTKLETPFFAVNGNQTTPENYQSYGLFIGNGDQDNYLKVVFMDGESDSDSEYGIQVLLEDGGSATANAYDIPDIMNAGSVDIYISVNPSANTAQPFVSLDNGQSIITVGSPVTLPANFLDATDDTGLAAGIISTSTGAGPEFAAIWDFLNITEDQPGVLNVTPDPLDYGTINSNAGAVELNAEAVNDGSPVSGSINITEINFSGTDASLFSSSASLPLSVGPGVAIQVPVTFTTDGTTGSKSGTMELVHSGNNSPVTVSLTATVADPEEPIIRINAGGGLVTADDGGPDWLANTGNGGGSNNGDFSFNTGESSSQPIPSSGKHSSIPSYISDAVFESLFNNERYDEPAGDEMQLNIPVPNGDYVVNLYMGNGYSGTSGTGERIFDIFIEGNQVVDDQDLSAEYGHQVGAMEHFPVTITDGEINIQWIHETQNPLVNAIEILGTPVQIGPITVDPIDDQTNTIGDEVDLAVAASGGDPNENFTYSIEGQPDGIDIEPTNGHIFGIIEETALDGGPAHDGVHSVTVTVSKPGSEEQITSFNWTVENVADNWIDKDENESYTARHECSFVQAGQHFFLFGGREGTDHMDKYDYSSDSWEEITNLPAEVEFNHFQATEYQGLIWVIGAFKNNNYPNETPADYIWAYDPANNEWIQGPEIPTSRKRGSAGLAVYNDKFYIVAGNTDGHDGGYVSWFDEFDPATGQWTQLTDAPRARDHFHVAVIGDKLYAASGRLSGGTGGVFAPLIPEVDVYDFTTESWTTLPSGQNLPTPRAAAVVVNFQDQLFVAGGEGNSQTYEETEAYDPTTGSWETKASLNYSRHGTQGIVSGNGIVVAAGSPTQGGGQMKNMEVYGEDSPSGISLTASQLNTPSAAAIPVGGSQSIDLTNSGGNVGIVITQLEITGTNAANFGVTDQFSLISAGETLPVSVTHTGSDTEDVADLIIHYGDGNTKTVSLTSGEEELEDVICINAGGPEYTTSEGKLFEADGNYTTPSSTYSTNSGISNTADETLYQTERYGEDFSYNIPLDNGVYNLELFFAEIYHGAPGNGSSGGAGDRLFTVNIEGNPVLVDFDIYADAGGALIANNKLFQDIEVTDGSLDIQFLLGPDGVDNAKINALCVTQGVAGDVNNPPTVTNPGTQTNEDGETGINLPISATDGDDGSQSLTYSATGLPPSLTINPNTGVISGNIDDCTSSGGEEGAFIESDGLVLIEAESNPSVPQWTIVEESGVTYQEAGSNNFGNATAGGEIDYEVQITTPGVYRFHMKSAFGGSEATEENDTWFRINNTSDVHFFCVEGGALQSTSEFETYLSTGDIGSKEVYYPAGNSQSRPDHGNENPGNNGFFKVYRSGGGGNKWDAQTIDNNNFPIYAYFPNAGTFTIEMAERSAGHKIDRIGLAHIDDVSTGEPASTLNGPESDRAQSGTCPSDNSPYSVVVSVTDDGTPAETTDLPFTWVINAPGQGTGTPEALIEVNPGGSLTASTYGNNSFHIENTGDVNIVRVELETSSGFMSDIVFDPVGTAGDNASKCVTTGSSGNTASEVGLSIPGNGGSGSDTDCVDPFFNPHNDVDNDEGFDGLGLDFSDFNAGENFWFGVDMDPTSIKNDNTSGDAGSVSGFEIIGARVTVIFADGSNYTTTLWEDGSAGGSQAEVAENSLAAPSISAQNLVTPTLTNESNQTICISGTPGATVELMRIDSRLHIDSGGGGYDIDPFEANEAMASEKYTATLDGSGEACIPVVLTKTTGSSSTPDGGINHFIAVETVSSTEQTSPASNTVVIEYDPNAVMGNTLTVNVSLESRSDYSGNYEVELYETSDLSTPAMAVTVNADASGSLSVPNVPNGTYRVAVKHPIFLQSVYDSDVVISDSDETITTEALLAGDADDDNDVDADDNTILQTTFFLIEGDAGYDERADWTGDGVVNVLDFSWMSKNFGITGEEVQ